MKRFSILTAALLTLSGRDDALPSAADIEEGYRNLSARNLARAIADFG